MWKSASDINETRGSVGWACVAPLSLCFDGTLYRNFYGCFLPNFN